jgi:hypothetical protein
LSLEHTGALGVDTLYRRSMPRDFAFLANIAHLRFPASRRTVSVRVRDR